MHPGIDNKAIEIRLRVLVLQEPGDEDHPVSTRIRHLETHDPVVMKPDLDRGW